MIVVFNTVAWYMDTHMHMQMLIHIEVYAKIDNVSKISSNGNGVQLN